MERIIDSAGQMPGGNQNRNLPTRRYQPPAKQPPKTSRIDSPGTAQPWNWNPGSSRGGKVVNNPNNYKMPDKLYYEGTADIGKAMGVGEMEKYAKNPSLERTIARRRAVENYASRNNARNYSPEKDGYGYKKSEEYKGDSPYEMEEWMMPGAGSSTSYNSGTRKRMLPDGRVLVSSHKVITHMFNKSWIEGSDMEGGNSETMEVEMTEPQALQGWS